MTHNINILGNKINAFRNTTCMSWNEINKNGLYKEAKEYLSDKRKVLDEMVEIEGYKSCHHMDSLDATMCAEDCKKFETEEFGKNCTKNGGLFKCCIRRDKKFCHECRFCCTLPMCTYKPGNKKDTHFDMDHRIVQFGNKTNAIW